MSERPALLLDVLGTLVHDPFDREIPAFFGMSRDELLRRQHPTVWVEFEHGAIDEEEYFRRYFADGRPVDRDALLARVRGAYRWLDGMEELLVELRDRGFELHALSNYPVWYRMIEERLALSTYVEWSFVSCETGVRKPSPEAYLGAARALGRPPGDCLFVDNTPSNCRAAEAVGMPALEFVGADALRSALARRGLP